MHEELRDEWTICTIFKDMHFAAIYLGKLRRYTTPVQYNSLYCTGVVYLRTLFIY